MNMFIIFGLIITKPNITELESSCFMVLPPSTFKSTHRHFWRQNARKCKKKKNNNNNNNLNTELNPFGISKPEIVIDATYVISNKKYDISFIISECKKNLQFFGTEVY